MLTEDDEQPEALAALLPLLCPQRQQLADAVEEAGQHGHRVVDLRLRELLEVGRELAPSPVERLDGRTHVLSGTDQPGEHPVELAAEVLEVSAEVAALILGIDPRTAVLGSRVADRVAVDRQVGGRLRRLGAVDAIFLILGERGNRGQRVRQVTQEVPDRLRTAARAATDGGGVVDEGGVLGESPAPDLHVVQRGRLVDNSSNRLSSVSISAATPAPRASARSRWVRKSRTWMASLTSTLITASERRCAGDLGCKWATLVDRDDEGVVVKDVLALSSCPERVTRFSVRRRPQWRGTGAVE